MAPVEHWCEPKSKPREHRREQAEKNQCKQTKMPGEGQPEGLKRRWMQDQHEQTAVHKQEQTRMSGEARPRKKRQN